MTPERVQRDADVGDDFAIRVEAVQEFDRRLHLFRECCKAAINSVPAERRHEVGMAASIVDIAYRKLRPQPPADRNLHLVPADAVVDPYRPHWGE